RLELLLAAQDLAPALLDRRLDLIVRQAAEHAFAREANAVFRFLAGRRHHARRRGGRRRRRRFGRRRRIAATAGEKDPQNQYSALNVYCHVISCDEGMAGKSNPLTILTTHASKSFEWTVFFMICTSLGRPPASM